MSVSPHNIICIEILLISVKAAEWSITLSLKSGMFLTTVAPSPWRAWPVHSGIPGSMHCTGTSWFCFVFCWETPLGFSRCHGSGNENVQQSHSLRKCLLEVVSLQNLVQCQSTTAALEFWILIDERQFCSPCAACEMVSQWHSAPRQEMYGSAAQTSLPVAVWRTQGGRWRRTFFRHEPGLWCRSPLTVSASPLLQSPSLVLWFLLLLPVAVERSLWGQADQQS